MLLASPARFERAAFRLGEPLIIYGFCSDLLRKALIWWDFLQVRVHLCASEFRSVVRRFGVHFSRFLEISKKGKMIVFQQPPILAAQSRQDHLHYSAGTDCSYYISQTHRMLFLHQQKRSIEIAVFAEALCSLCISGLSPAFWKVSSGG